MITGVIIAFREALETALLVGIVVRYLTQTNRAHFHKTVWRGLLAGLSLSAIFGYILFHFGGGMSGEGKEALEIGATTFSIFLIGTFLFWIKHHQTSTAITSVVEKKMLDNEKTGLFFLILFSVLREGGETALFTFAGAPADRAGALSAILLGAVPAGLLGFALFTALARVPIKQLFIITSIFLILAAAGMSRSLAGALGSLAGWGTPMRALEWGVWVIVAAGGGVLLFRDQKKIKDKKI